MAYSSIKKKGCKCGCGKMPSMGFNGFFYLHAPEEVKSKAQDKRSKANLAKKAKSKLPYTKNSEVKKRSKKGQFPPTTSSLIKKLDLAFAKWVKKRDSDENGYIQCPCCRLKFHLGEKNEDKTPVVNALHFIKRSVYSLRWEEKQVFAGCCKCNLDMHLNPTGRAYQSYKLFLINKFGEYFVHELESRSSAPAPLPSLQPLLTYYLTSPNDREGNTQYITHSAPLPPTHN